MNISIEDIKKIIEDASKKGFKIGVRDIAFVVLLDAFENEDIAYKCLFGSESGFMQEYASVYARTGAVEYIKDYIDILSNCHRLSAVQIAVSYIFHAYLYTFL